MYQEFIADKSARKWGKKIGVKYGLAIWTLASFVLLYDPATTVEKAMRYIWIFLILSLIILVGCIIKVRYDTERNSDKTTASVLFIGMFVYSLVPLMLPYVLLLIAAFINHFKF